MLGENRAYGLKALQRGGAGAIIGRRAFLRCLVKAAGGLGLIGEGVAEANRLTVKIGACDWSLGALASVQAFEIAREIGLGGVQVSLGTERDGMKLRRTEVQQEYLDAARRTGVKIASLAIGELNRVPFKSDPRTIEWVRDAIDVARRLGSQVILLAFFGDGDLKHDASGRREVCRRLRELAPYAEQRGIILGIESWLSAAEHLEMIEAIGSPAVKVYYDVANSWQMGYRVPEEIRLLGRKGLICEMHMKENGALLGRGVVDFKAVRAAMADIGYEGWVQIEGARPQGMQLVEAYRHNLVFLRRLFAGEG